ncbi:hypothetical protein SAMN05444392_102253 [Seinonella peptonophila]|uniref:Uncharacterized protein n=1 Tax=Seinonella peptonophila TaxID=112248 RepID=A0A1M4VA92_9BACL|nr:hypothetical protein [Seinonella peptonophila]SHE65728.1 hypothetical protein SAMN05444392_102253 [Seinonella peptonophila]
MFKSIENPRVKFLKLCEDCEGEGVITPEIWKRWSAQVDALKKEHPTLSRLDIYEMADKWFHEAYEHDIHDFPNEEDCETCNGQGKVISKELQPLKELMDMLRYYNMED